MTNLCIERARGGDPSATEAVVEHLRPRISKMASYYARRCGEDPDDLLQEAWVGLLEALPDLDLRIGSPEQHLILRARWRLLDAIKRARVRRCAPLEDVMLEDMSEENDENGFSDACMSEFTDRLNPTQRTVLDYLVDGFTWREVGDFLGCSSANVAYHVRQIKRQYERCYGDV